MHARYQLNAFYACVCLLAAIVIGLMFQSWVAFVLALVAIVIIKLQDGGIRLGQQPSSLRARIPLRRQTARHSQLPRERFRRS